MIGTNRTIRRPRARVSTSARARASVGATVFVLLGAVVGVTGWTTSVGAAEPNPCKVFTRAELSSAFGAPVGPARVGFDTSSSSQCEYRVAAASGRPQGTVVVHLTTKNAKRAFERLARQPAQNVPIPGLADASYSSHTRVASILAGDVVLALRGDFIATEPLPVHAYDVEAQLAQLAGMGAGRV